MGERGEGEVRLAYLGEVGAGLCSFQDGERFGEHGEGYTTGGGEMRRGEER